MTRSLDADFFSRSPKTLAVAFAARAFVVSALGIGAERARGNLDELWALSILLVNLYSPWLPEDAKRRVEERFARLGMGSTFSAMSPPSDTRLMTLLGATWEAKDTAELWRLGGVLASHVESVGGAPVFWKSVGVVLTRNVVNAILEVEPLKELVRQSVAELLTSGETQVKETQGRAEVRSLAQRISQVAESQAPTLGSTEDRWALSLLLACWWLRRSIPDLRTALAAIPAVQTVFGVFDQKPQLLTFMATISIVTGTPSDAPAYADSFSALLRVWSVVELRLALQLPPVVAAKDAVVGLFGAGGGPDTEPVLGHLITLGYTRDEALRALAGKA